MGGGNARRNTALRDSRLLQLDHRLLWHQYPTVESVYSPLRGSAKPEFRGPLILLYHTSDSETLGHQNHLGSILQ